MMFQQGDIVRITVGNDLPDPNYDLPEKGWDAIIVDVDADADEIEVAWLAQFTTPLKTNGTPVREYWDNATVVVNPEYDCHVTLIKRATYEVLEVGG